MARHRLIRIKEGFLTPMQHTFGVKQKEIELSLKKIESIVNTVPTNNLLAELEEYFKA